MKRIGLTILLASTVFFAQAQAYSMLLLKADMLKNANAVKRYEKLTVEILGTDKFIEKHTYAITILNEAADRYSGVQIGYDKSTSAPTINATMYDQFGNKIKELKRSEIKDESAYDGFSIAGDDRVRSFQFYNKSYPYTVVFEIEQKHNQTLFLPYWMPQLSNTMSVQESEFELVVKDGADVGIHTTNYNGTANETVDGSTKTYKWQLKNLPAMAYEWASPKFNKLTPMVQLSSKTFELYGAKGNLVSWKSLGAFQNELNKGRDELPPAIKTKVQELTQGITDPYQKIQRLYEFMQKNTRYISIQLGIGGWQPFPASYVAEKGYGDCKALTNYMYSLLKEAGIKSCYTTIRAGRYETHFTPEFPKPQFNHVILAVPLPAQQDTVWLECTSQSLPAGFLGDFTQNRYCLLINEEGGHLVRTPSYDHRYTADKRKVVATITPEGDLKANIYTRYFGLTYDEKHTNVANTSREKIVESLKEALDLPQYDVVNFNYTDHKSKQPFIEEAIDLTANGYASVTSKRLFFTPNLMNRSGMRLDTVAARKLPVEIEFGYTDTDTIEYHLPQGYTLEASTKDVSVQTAAISYSAKYVIADNKVTYIRAMQLRNGSYAPSEYNQIVQAYQQIYKADRGRLVFVKKEG